MQEMKYVVMEDLHGGKSLIIFPKSINHDCMAEVAGRIKDQSNGDWERVFRKPVSAGFTNGIVCYGESISLGLKADKYDSNLL